jgi:hypothetical protein
MVCLKILGSGVMVRHFFFHAKTQSNAKRLQFFSFALFANALRLCVRGRIHSGGMLELLRYAMVLTCWWLVSCNTNTTEPMPTLIAPRPQATTAPTPQPTATMQVEEGVFATLERSGGFTGKTTTYVINFDGVVINGMEVLRVADGKTAVTKLAAQIEATGIYLVAPGEYLPKGSCYDCYYFDVTLTRRGQTYHYETVERADTAPQALWATITLILQYVELAR